MTKRFLFFFHSENSVFLHCIVVNIDTCFVANEKREFLVIFVYLLSLPVAHLSDAPRRRLIVTGDSARIQDEATENSAWFFNVLGV